MLKHAIILLLITISAPVYASPKGAEAPASRLAVEDYLGFQEVLTPAVSPDGRWVIYTVKSVDRMKDQMRSEAWVMASDGTGKRKFLDGRDFTWSPDSSRVAFLAEGEDGKEQIFIYNIGEMGVPYQVTHEPETPRNILWSPDGGRLAFRRFVAAPEPAWDIDMPAAPEGAAWAPEPKIIDTLHYKQERFGLNRRGFNHLFVVPVEGGPAAQITSGNWSVGSQLYGWDIHGDMSWSPDGKTIYFDGLWVAEGVEDTTHDNNQSYLYAVTLKSGKVRKLFSAKGYWASPKVSPDGKHIAFKGLTYTSRVLFSQQLWVSDIDGSNRRIVSGDMFGGIEMVKWSHDSSQIFFDMEYNGQKQIYAARPKGGVAPLTNGNHFLSLSSVDQADNLYATRTTPYEPANLVRFDAGRETPVVLTAVHKDWLAGKKLGEVREVNYPSSDGLNIQGWVVLPPDYDGKTRLPLLLSIHGGPQAMYSVTFDFGKQYYAAKGFAVLYVNPRGSTGYGRKFVEAIFNQYPGQGDYEDLMNGVDYAIQQGWADKDRLFVEGCSGGGALTAWIVGHTTRFKAAASRCAVINWISMQGTGDVVTFVSNQFEKPFWEDPQTWLEHSPIMHVDKVKTPTLMMHGALDLRVSIGQAEEFYTALKLRGVPTKLIRFENEWHGTESVPSNMMRTLLYMEDWFNTWDSSAR